MSIMSSKLTDPIHGPDDTADYPILVAGGPRVQVHHGAITHPGRVRARNEDQFLVAKLAKSVRICGSSLPEDDVKRYSDEEGYLMIVADGMGGVAAGEEASAVAVKTVEAFMLDAVKWFLHREGYEQNALIGELRHALERADMKVVERANSDPKRYGMGTTLTMAYSVQKDLFVAHAGDSRAYLLREGRLEQITSDHTLVQLLVDSGAITPAAAREHPRRNIITNVIGGPKLGVQAEIHRLTLDDGDILLLCSDGLTEVVPETEIARILQRHHDPEIAAKRLVDTTLDRGAPDNVTVVVARYAVR